MTVKRHRARSALGALMLLVFASSCASDPVASLECDEPGFVLGYQMLAEGPLYLGTDLHFENGRPFLFVDGECRYWAYAPSGRPAAWWSEVRTGQLRGEVLDDFNARVLDADWSAIDGVRIPSPPDVSHGGMRWMWRDSIVGACGFDCALAPAPMRALVEDLKEMTVRLYELGEPYVGAAVRVASQRVGESESEPVLWAGRESPGAWETAAGFGGHARVEGEDAALLRQLRAGYLASGRLPEPLVVREGDILWALDVREALPFEDARGLVRPPGP